jgi:nucleotide-binding universal stress UspA family protein
VLERILVAVDGSEAASAAVTAVARLVPGGGIQALVVHVTDQGPLQRTVYGPNSLTLQWETPADARALVDDAAASLRAAGIDATGQVYGQFDTIARQLLDTAHAHGAGLIAMGSRGRGRIAGILLGSVTHRVIHLADVSVLAAPPSSAPTVSPYRRILLAIDGSAASRRVVEVAAEVARRTGAHLLVLHVWEPNRASAQRYLPEGMAIEHDTPEMAGGLVDQAVAGIEGSGLSASATVGASRGSVAEAIVEAAQNDESELIVVGSRGRAALPALVLGSTTYRLLHIAPIPILVAR